ncbi:MAG: hypothetical protein NC341_09520 [Blautia sp.]|nr:hypothetical protein [Blautia sp.]MCM1201423.1 hypothetical protein [Bacteroides fragilis]
MTVKIDFTLNHRFGVVEQAVFHLVLNGVTDIRQIGGLLWIFSDAVLANALRKLVNQQILSADMEARRLSLSDPVSAVIETCIHHSYPLDVPDALEEAVTDGPLFITDIGVKEAILAHLLPDVKLGFLAKALDFSISRQIPERKGRNRS